MKHTNDSHVTTEIAYIYSYPLAMNLNTVDGSKDFSRSMGLLPLNPNIGLIGLNCLPSRLPAITSSHVFDDNDVVSIYLSCLSSN